MKLAIASDFHLGFNDDALAQARQALDKASVADAVLLPGDLLDWRVPSLEVLHDAIRLFSSAKTNQPNAVRMSRVTPEGKTTPLDDAPRLIAIYGTHERRAKGMSNSIQLLDAAGLLTNCHATTILLEKTNEKGETEKVAVQGMGGVPEEYSSDVLKALDFKPVPGAFNIFIFHQTLREAIPQATDGLNAADLPKGFDLYVDGHIHWHAFVQTPEGKPVLLPGSTVITQMKKGEVEPKRVFFVDTTKASPSLTPSGVATGPKSAAHGRAVLPDWITSETIASRPFHYVELTFDGATLAEVEETVKREVHKVAAQSTVTPLVKVKLQGSLKNGLSAGALDAGELERALSEIAKVSVDKEFDNKALAERIEQLRKLRDQRTSATELGITLLEGKLKAANWKLTRAKTNAEGETQPDEQKAHDGVDARELFELLAEGEVDKAQAKLG